MRDDNLISWNLRWNHPSLRRRQITEQMVLDHCDRHRTAMLELRVQFWRNPEWQKGYDVCFRQPGTALWGARPRVKAWGKYYRYEKLPGRNANDA